jgi:hypothetical protein
MLLCERVKGAVVKSDRALVIERLVPAFPEELQRIDRTSLSSEFLPECACGSFDRGPSAGIVFVCTEEDLCEQPVIPRRCVETEVALGALVQLGRAPGAGTGTAHGPRIGRLEEPGGDELVEVVRRQRAADRGFSGCFVASDRLARLGHILVERPS